MNNLTGLQFYVNEDLNLVVDDHRGPTTRHKVVSMDSLCKMIEKHSERKTVQSGLLPTGCISYCERFDNQKFVALDLGRYRMDLRYENTTYENFPVPRLLYGFYLDSQNKITDVQIAVADLWTLREDTALYVYPFSNVAGFDLCIGQNKLPKIKELRQLASIPYYIFSMPDNNDRYTLGHTRLHMEYRTLLEFLKDKDERFYYSDVLVPSGKTLRDFLQY